MNKVSLGVILGFSKIMKRLVILMSALCLAAFGFTQTKMIAFKSHSGSVANFKTALLNPKFDLTNHNLGMAPDPIVRTAAIDSVIFISDSLAVMITSEHCTKSSWYDRSEPAAEPIVATTWRQGKDTVVFHPLFSHPHSLDSIKNVLKTSYYFQNDIDSTVFIGYDNGPVSNNESESHQNSLPLITAPENKGPGPALLIFFAALFAGFIGLVSWRMSQLKSLNSFEGN